MKTLTLIALFAIAMVAFGDADSISIPDTTTAPADTGIVLEFKEMMAEIYSLNDAGEYIEAESLATLAIEFAESKWGEEDTLTAETYNILGVVYSYQGKYEDAKLLYERALSIWEKVLGPEHPDVAASLNNLAGLYRAQGHYSQAEPLFERALSIWEKALGPEHPTVATSLNNLALLYRNQGHYLQAEPLFERALSIREKALGPEHPSVAASLNNLAGLYRAQGHYSKAETLHKRALSIREKALGPEHPQVALSLNNLAVLYREQGHYSQVEPLFKRALSIREKALGPEHPAVAQSLHSLAALHRFQGNYSKAEPLFDRALSISEKTLGPEHPDLANMLNSLAVFYYSQGLYSQAEPLYERALSIREKALGPENPHVASSLDNLASLFQAQGHYSQAEPLLKRALSIREKSLGHEHPHTAISLNSLAMLYRAQGHYSKAEPLDKRALSVREKTLGSEHPYVATSLNSLAELYLLQGQYQKVEPLLERALSIREKVLGPDHQDVSISLNNLARLYRAQGYYSQAEPLFERALSILEKAFGPEHPDVAIALNNLALVYRVQGNYSQAEPLYERANEIYTKQLAYSAGYMSEGRFISYLNSIRIVRRSYENFLFNYYAEKPNISANWFDHLLSFKGASGRSATAMRSAIVASGDTVLIRAADEMTTVRGQIATLEMREDTLLEVYIAELKAKADSLEDFLTRESAEYRNFEAEYNVKWTDVRQSLKDGEVAVEITTAFDYEDSLFHYVALLVKPDSEYPEVVRLSSFARIDTVMNLYAYLANPHVLEEHANIYNNRLYETMWQPLEESFAGSERIYLCPEGEYYKVNFNMLKDDDGQYLMEKYDIRIVNSTIDITRPDIVPTGEICYLFGAPDYEWFGEIAQEPADTGWQFELAMAETRSARTRDLRDLDFKPLPGTEREVLAIAEKLKRQGVRSEVALGTEATEEAVKQVDNPRILHIATHGFVLEDQEYDSLARGRNESPMLRAGLALTGANRIPKGIEIQPGDEDGILTASEMMDLRLRGTELVVLSACETGLGKAQTGEGVFGKRRALQLAGAKYILLSLWAVPDRETQELMELFYDDYLSGVDVHTALKNAQTKMQSVITDLYGHDMPFYWGAFIVVGR